MEQKQILSPEELSAELGVHIVTLASARQANSKSEFSSLPFIRIGRKIFYRREDVDSFLKKHTVVGGGAAGNKDSRHSAAGPAGAAGVEEA